MAGLIYAGAAIGAVFAGDLIGVLAESQSRMLPVELTEHALHRIGARGVRVTVASPKLQDPLPVRSTGATYAYDMYPEIMQALGACSLVVDCTVEGLLHSKARQELLGAGGRVFHCGSNRMIIPFWLLRASVSLDSITG